MALLPEQKQVYSIIKEYDDKLGEPAANATAIKGRFQRLDDSPWCCEIDHPAGHGTEETCGIYGHRRCETLWEKLASAYKSKLKFNIFEIREDFWCIKLQDCWDVDNYALRINRKIKDYNLCDEPTATSTAGTDATNTDTDANAKTIAKVSEQEDIFYLLCGIPRNDQWKVFLQLMVDKNTTMTATPDEIVPKHLEMEASIKRENGLAPKTLLFAKKGVKGSRGGKGSKSPKMDKRHNKGDNNGKEKDLRKCVHRQQRGHITEDCLSK